MSLHDRRRLRETFDEVPHLYERLRPGYPALLFQDLVALGGVRPGARVLEIGCGTGQATRELARRGYNILCVELGESLAQLARRGLAQYPHVRVVTSPFETWDPDGLSFDLVLAATSWHWLDPERRYVKAAAVLKPEGALAIVSTHHVLPEDGDQFFTDIQDTYNAIGEVDSPPPPPDQVSDERADIEASNLFGDVKVRRYLWEQAYTEEQYLALLDTYSGHRLMAPWSRRVLNEEVGRRIRSRPDNRVRKHYLFLLHVARRVSSSNPETRRMPPLGDRRC
jgi:SAM-dependent methyltransferase